ncbi:S-methyl-5-thioribose-1-phosphate isomerase [Candidatus Omnitrophota bacterium]
MKIQTIAWEKGAIKIIDQTKLPNKLEYVYLKDIRTVYVAIKSMKIRGAPALAAAGALGVVLAAYREKFKTRAQFMRKLEKAISFLASSRPTAVNLFWGLERMRSVLEKSRDTSPAKIKTALLQEADRIIEEDRIACRKMSERGARLIRNGDRILTVCNAGILATIDYGTALGVIYKAKQAGKRFKVFACETRPLLQGARLTAWELKKKGIDVTLICDSMAASLMRRKQITKVFSGADRIALNGDVANKIGTYSLAVLAKWHCIPFYVVAPLSTFDRKIRTGGEIPIEERSALEVTHNFFKQPIAPSGVKVLNPAFDVTPHQLVTAIITETAIFHQGHPFTQSGVCPRGERKGVPGF